MQKSQWKIDFYPFSLPSSMTFVILYTSVTYQIFWGWLGGGGTFAGLGGYFEFGGSGGGLYKSLKRLLASSSRNHVV